MHRYKLSWVILLFIVFIPLNAKAYQIIERKLPEIVSGAQLVVRGVCESKEMKTIQSPLMQGEVPVTHYVFSVKEIIKGTLSSDKFEFDLFGVGKNEAKELGVPYAVGFVTLTPDEEFVLFLGPKSSLGVWDIVGLHQGTFSVFYDDAGQAKVVNIFSNKNLFGQLQKDAPVTKALMKANIDVTSFRKGPMSYKDFINAVKAIDSVEVSQ